MFTIDSYVSLPCIHSFPVVSSLKRFELWINPDVKDFYDFTIDDFKLINYKHGDKLYFEVAV